jgi:hypothetical protein
MVPGASAQVTNTVFSDSFSGTTLNTNKWTVTGYSQEGGSGQFVPAVENGVVEFTGTTTDQWWGGGELQISTNFPVNAETNVVFTVTRVSDNGPSSDTARRSMMFILPTAAPPLNDYVLFGEDITETYWEYNQKVGLSSDVPTGSGTAISAFNATSEDGLSHVMTAVVNGSTVSLYLDGVFGVSAPFPFNTVTFSFGAEARANNDTVDVTFSSPTVQTVGFEVFSPSSVTLLMGQSASNVVVRIPPGANKSKAVHVTVTSDTPSVAVPAGAVNGSSTLTFAAGASNEQTLSVQSVGVGGAIFSLSNDIGMGSANTLSVVVLLGPGVRLTENFVGNTINTSTWAEDTNGFNASGIGTFTAEQTNGTLVISGEDNIQQYWPGLALETIAPFTATPQLPLQVTVTRVAIEPISNFSLLLDTGARSDLFLTTAGWPNSTWAAFGQDVGEDGWVFNSNLDSPTGTGTAFTQFASLDSDTNSHQMMIVADGTEAEVFLDGVLGGSFPFAATAGIYVQLGAYARASGDSVIAVFSHLEVQNILPPISVSPVTFEIPAGVNTNVVTVTVPQLRTNGIAVTITSQNPTVATPQGAVNGALTLQFPEGATNVQTFDVVAAGVGQTSFVITDNQALAITGTNIAITVTTPTTVWFSDTFTNSVINSNYWTLSTNSPGITDGVTNSALSITNGELEMYVKAIDSTTAYLWGGYGLYMRTSFAASLLSPIVFQVDRVGESVTLLGGSGTLEWTGVWITGPDTNYVWFGDYDTHSGQAGGWEYFDSIGATTNSPLAGVGVVLAPLATLDDLGNHTIKVEANGSVVEMYVDGIYGGSAPFPYTNGISFGLGTYVDTCNNFGSIVWGYYSNVTVSGPQAAQKTLSALSFAKLSNGSIQITWTGAGTLQSSSSLTSGWADVTPAPTGTTYTVSPTGSREFFRLSQ